MLLHSVFDKIQMYVTNIYKHTNICFEFYILSKTECKSIHYCFRRDHESSSFRKLARNKMVFCQETCDFFAMAYWIKTYLTAINVEI